MMQNWDKRLKKVGGDRNNSIVREVKVDVAVNQFGKEGWEWTWHAKGFKVAFGFLQSGRLFTIFHRQHLVLCESE